MGKELLRYEARPQSRGDHTYYEIVEVFRIFYNQLWEEYYGDVVDTAEDSMTAWKKQDEWNAKI